MLGRLFGSESRAKIIKFFCSRSQQEFYLREISRVLDIQLNALSRELDNLEEIGFLTARTLNNRKYYRVDEKFPLLGELKALLYKSVVLLERAIVKDLQKIRGFQVFILTGIFINQETGTDILLVGSVDRKKVHKLIASLSQQFYQDIRFTFLTPPEYKYRLEVTDKFIYNILNLSPIVIINKYAR